MAYQIIDPVIGLLPISEKTSTAGRVTLGTIVRARDSTDGIGEFIFLLGVSGTAAGSLVTYNATTWQTALSPTTGASGAPVAVAMSANLGSSYGWYQISGIARILKTAVAITPQVKLYVSGTQGRVYATASAGKLVQGAKSANLTTVASGTSSVAVMIDRPALRGVTSAI